MHTRWSAAGPATAECACPFTTFGATQSWGQGTGSCGTGLSVAPPRDDGRVRTTGTVRHKPAAQHRSQREVLFSDISQAPFALGQATTRDRARIHYTDARRTAFRVT